METVDVLVRVFDRGQTKEVTVPVEAACFDPERLCWKSIDNIKAAALLGLPFTLLERVAKYGLRPADREQLREMYGGAGGTDPSAPASPSLRMTEGGTEHAEGS